MRLRARPALATALVVALATPGCVDGLGKPPPLDRPSFPMGVAVSGDRLAITSSNNDFAFDDGAVLLADLAAISGALTGPDVVLEGAYVAGVRVPTFADRPVFDASGKHLFVTTRDQNLLHELVVEGTTLSCGGEDGAGGGRCDQAPQALAFAGLDPFATTIISDDGAGAVRGLVTFQAAREGVFFTLNPASDGADRLRLEQPPLDFGEGSFGVRAVAHRPAQGGAAPRLFASVDIRTDGARTGVELVSFPVPGPGRSADVAMTRLDVTALVGSISVQDLVLVPQGADGTAAALIVALSFPDALARFDVDVTGNLTLTHLSDTCQRPLSMAAVPVASGAPATSVLVTCHDSNAVMRVDTATLAVRATSRQFGRGPTGIAVDAARERAFVAYFLDDSVGVFDIANGELRPVGRLGKQKVKPEDGRE